MKLPQTNKHANKILHIINLISFILSEYNLASFRISMIRKETSFMIGLQAKNDLMWSRRNVRN